MVSTVASGNVEHFRGPADISMVYSVTDISGINRISERVLSNGPFPGGHDRPSQARTRGLEARSG
jgi:hypothetical protein